VRILIDVNLSRTWKTPFAAAGHDAVHWEDIGPDDAPDEDIMRYADDNDLVILTNDLDFAKMLALSSMKRPSVIQIRSGSLRPSLLQKQVLAAVKQEAAALEMGAIVTVRPQSSKASVLPLRPNPSI
jgi:predicted nuclease of predicted toxin-antitoxin system